MAFVFSFSLLYLIKGFTLLFYRFDTNWLTEKTVYNTDDVRLMVILNHTSLFEPMFVRLAPNSLIKRISRKLLVPGADITTSRPIVGRLFRRLLPGIIPISRKRDDTWHYFLSHIEADSFVAILPEGRMRRRDGLDKYGKKMTVRGGVADIIERLDGGHMLLVYSGGLHHIQIPGQRLPKVFKRIKVSLEMLNIQKYKKQLSEVLQDNGKSLKQAIMEDMQRRLEDKVPFCEQQPYNQKH